MGSPVAWATFLCLFACSLTSPQNETPLATEVYENATMGEFHSPAEAGSESAGQYEGEAKAQELASGGTGGREGGGGEDLPVCECTFSADTDYTCKCPSMNGIIKRQDIPDGIYTLKYYIQSSSPGTVIAYFKYDDVKTLSSLCKLTIGETVFDSPGDLSETNVVYADTETPIEVYGYFQAGLCDYTLEYYTFLPTTDILILNATEGYLTAPADETGMFSYKPNAEVLWILQPDIPVSEFNFTIEYLDLGLPENNIHGSNKMNFTEGDFLVIGPGEDLLQGNDNMFYGIREPEDLKKVVTLGGTSHVYFTSTVTKFNASGFNISYTTSVFEPTTTPFPVTTVNPPSPEDEQTTYLASIEGASTDKTILNQTIDSFKVAMVNMSSEYVRMKSWVTKGPITTDSVIIYEVLTCDTSICNPECLAFNFSIAALDYNDAWIFTAPVIEDMLFTPELQSSLDHIGKDCSVCDEDRTLNLWMYIGVPVGIVVFATILSLVLWTMGSRSNLEAMSATEGHGPGLFRLGRVWPFPSIYPDWRTPVTQDVLLMGWVAAFFALLLPFYLVIPASNDKLSRAIRVTLFLLLGLSIMRKPQNESTTLAGETINYNERFTWAWAQGRSGFGPYAGQIQRDFRAAQQRGSPYPILWVAEYFTFDGEGIRFGRHYRTAGWYSHIALWAAFPTWVMTVLLFKMVVRYAALALVLIGILLVIPVLIWYSYRNPIELQIPFEDGILKTSFGWCFYLALVVGLACIVIGSVLFRLSLGDFEAKLTDFFGNNPWKLSEEVDYNVTGVGTRRGRERSVSMIEMERINTSSTRFSPGLPLSPRSHGGDSRLTSSGSFSSPRLREGQPNAAFSVDSPDGPSTPRSNQPLGDDTDLCDDVFSESSRTKTDRYPEQSLAPETEQ